MILIIVLRQKKTYFYTSFNCDCIEMSRRNTFFIFIISLFFGCTSPTAKMDNYDINGIDVSHHQVIIDWNTVSKQDIDFAFIKATEGGDHLDSLFCQNWVEIYDHHIVRGAYHFFRPNISPKLQSENFINQVELAEGDLPPVLDVEVTGDLSRIQLMTKVQKWLTLVEKHYHVKPIIYTNNKFYNKYFAGYFSEYPLWIARYNHEQPKLIDDNNWTFWQYGNRGQVDGIIGEVDLNVFYGDSAQFQQILYQTPILISLN